VPPEAIVRSARVGAEAPLGDWVLLRSSPGDQLLTVTLAEKGAELRGLVTDAKGPAAGVWMAVVPVKPDGFAGRARFQQTDATGRFRIRRLPAGEYRLGRIDGRDREALMRGTDLSLRESVVVTMREGEVTEREVRLP
jgi:hypothetical protein